MIIDVTIEIPMGSKHKYEINKETGKLYLDRVLDVAYPTNYGFVNGTLAPDSDALDMFCISDEPILSLVEAKVKLIGMFKCLDNSVEDDKLVAVLGEHFNDASTLQYHIDKIETFLKSYKKDFKVLHYFDVNEAIRTLNTCRID